MSQRPSRSQACIQLKQFSLGFALVACFIIGLALTMVSAGVIAARSVRHVAGRRSDFSTFARRLPYASAPLVVRVGFNTGWLGWEESGMATRRMRPHGRPSSLLDG